MGFGLLPSLPTRQVRDFENNISGIWKNIKGIWGHLNVEFKHHDKTATGTQVAAGTWSDLCEIPAGITGNGDGAIDQGYRDGDKIRVKSLQVRGQITKAGASTATDISHIFVIKYYDNFTGNGPSIAQVYDQYSNSVLNNRLRRPEFRGQYKILAHKVITLSGVEDRDNAVNFNIYMAPKKRKGTYVEWEGASSNSKSNGKYYLFDYSEGGTNQINWSSRLTYIDN